MIHYKNILFFVGFSPFSKICFVYSVPTWANFCPSDAEIQVKRILSSSNPNELNTSFTMAILLLA